MPPPSPNGRSARGRFARGNPGGPGNPHAKRTSLLRAALLEAVTEDDIRAVAHGLVAKARSGDTAATRELLDRVIGKVRPEEGVAEVPEPLIDLPDSALKAVADTIRQRRYCDRCAKAPWIANEDPLPR